MKTIEERATEYACDGCMPDGGECDSCYNIHGKCERDAYIAGAKTEREEMTRWHDPKEELPEIPDGKHRSKKVLLKKESGDYVIGWVEFINGNARWTDARVVFQNIIGWREIHE